MLNRVLSLIAEFFEAHPNPHHFSANSGMSTEILFPALAALEAALSHSSSLTSSSCSTSSSPLEVRKDLSSVRTGEIESTIDEVIEEIPWSMLTDTVSGDPDLESSIRLAMKLQQMEYERGLSSSSLESSSSAEVSSDI